MVELHSFNARVSEAFESLGETKEVAQTKIQKYQSQKNEFYLVEKQLKELDLDSSSKIISEVRIKWVSASKSFVSVVDDCSQILLHLLQKKHRFEQLFKVLQSKEQNLMYLRQTLQNILQDFHDNKEFDFLSNQYTKPKEIKESQMNNLFTNNSHVSNVSIHLESSEDKKVIEVDGYVCVKRLYITSAKKGVKYLQFVLKNSTCKIEFYDCKFQGVGLQVTGYQNTSCVFLKNVEVSDAPYNSIRVKHCNNFHMKDGVLKNSMWGLVFHNVSSSIVEEVTSSDMLYDGFHFNNSNSFLKNCVARNAKSVGVYVTTNCTVKTQNMKFEGNKQNMITENGGNYSAI